MFLQHRAARALVTLAGIAVAAAACGGSSSGGTQKVAATSGSGTAAAAVATHSGPDGAYLTDKNGRTLYIFSKDKGTTSSCSGACAKEWIPYTNGGSTQVTYSGHPLYYFIDDKATGDMKGEGVNDFGGLWTAVSPSGAPVTASQPSSSPSSSGSGGGSSSGGSSSEWG